MKHFLGKIVEFKWIPGAGKAARFQCPRQNVPAPGRYVLASDPALVEELFATPLFLMESLSDGFWAAPPTPDTWQLGASLAMRGPLGKGFHPPSHRHLALAVVEGAPSRLLPVMNDSLRQDAAVALFISGGVPEGLPAAVEVYPLEAIPEAWGWADFLVMDIPARRLAELRSLLGLSADAWLSCPGQALVQIPMPCGGIAACGICAVPSGRQHLYLCSDGPVVDLALLLK